MFFATGNLRALTLQSIMRKFELGPASASWPDLISTRQRLLCAAISGRLRVPSLGEPDCSVGINLTLAIERRGGRGGRGPTMSVRRPRPTTLEQRIAHRHDAIAIAVYPTFPLP